MLIQAVDAEILKDAERFKMDLVAGLERTLQGKVKPSADLSTRFTCVKPAANELSTVITQCSIRHLYTLSPREHPHKDAIIDLAKRFERRRCNHHELEEPLSEKECLEAVVIHNSENKHRYCVATQGGDIRAMLRAVPGVPLVYISRSVMIMEPMAPISAMRRERGEREKFRAGIKDIRPKGAAAGNKRKWPLEGEEEEGAEGGGGKGEGDNEGGEEKKKKKRRGLKGPNPLSVKKKKPQLTPSATPKAEPSKVPTESKEGDSQEKKKRKRKHKSARAERAEAGVDVQAESPLAT
jgi:U3 small nucleolar RNA-associated protein 23